MPSEMRMLQNRTPIVQTEVETINVNPGETLTVYMRDKDGAVSQVELRVKPKGGPEMFVRGPTLERGVKSFDAWAPMREGD